MTAQTPYHGPTREDYRDAIGWMYASYRGDTEAKSALGLRVDPVGLVDALTRMFAGLINLSTNGNPEVYLDHVRANLDTIMDQGQVPE